MDETATTTERHSLRGPTDRAALITVRDLIEQIEPLARPRLDDYLNPSVLRVHLSDGLCDADRARIDVQWTTQDDFDILLRLKAEESRPQLGY